MSSWTQILIICENCWTWWRELLFSIGLWSLHPVLIILSIMAWILYLFDIKSILILFVSSFMNQSQSPFSLPFTTLFNNKTQTSLICKAFDCFSLMNDTSSIAIVYESDQLVAYLHISILSRSISLIYKKVPTKLLLMIFQSQFITSNCCLSMIANLLLCCLSFNVFSLHFIWSLSSKYNKTIEHFCLSPSAILLSISFN